jgi:hypothetical protein
MDYQNASRSIIGVHAIGAASELDAAKMKAAGEVAVSQETAFLTQNVARKVGEKATEKKKRAKRPRMGKRRRRM